MASQGRLYCNLGSLAVADLTDHDDVGILAQDRTQTVSEGQVDLRVDLNLADTWQLVLNRIFDRDDILFATVQAGQRRVQSGGFTGTGRSGDQENSVVFVDHPLELVQQSATQANFFKRENVRGFIEQAQYNPFTKGCWQGSNANIFIASSDPHPEPAILRQTFFGNVK